MALVAQVEQLLRDLGFEVIDPVYIRNKSASTQDQKITAVVTPSDRDDPDWDFIPSGVYVDFVVPQREGELDKLVGAIDTFLDNEQREALTVWVSTDRLDSNTEDWYDDVWIQRTKLIQRRAD